MTWMNTKEFADHLRTNTGQVIALCKNGTITAIKVGVGWRIAVEKADEELLELRTRQVRKYNKPSATLAEAVDSYKKAVGV